MIIEKFNLKAQKIIESACHLAFEQDHSLVTPWHLLHSLFESTDSIGRQYLERANIDLARLVQINGVYKSMGADSINLRAY